MNNFSKKKLFLLGACGGVIVAICSDDKKPYLRYLGYIAVSVLIGGSYELGRKDSLEKEMKNLEDISTVLSEEFKTEETE